MIATLVFEVIHLMPLTCVLNKYQQRQHYLVIFNITT